MLTETHTGQAATHAQVGRVHSRMRIINENKTGELSQAESILPDPRYAVQEFLQNVIFQHFLYLNLSISNYFYYVFYIHICSSVD